MLYLLHIHEQSPSNMRQSVKEMTILVSSYFETLLMKNRSFYRWVFLRQDTPSCHKLEYPVTVWLK
jgi:hypothetical protein